jgi:hypothetical protein
MHRRCDINPVVVMCWHIAARGSIDQHHERNWSHAYVQEPTIESYDESCKGGHELAREDMHLVLDC